MKDDSKWWESMECRPGIVDKAKILEEMVRIYSSLLTLDFNST